MLDGRIAASVRCSVKDSTLYIEKLVVDPDYQNRGIGTWLMREIEDRYAHLVSRYELFTDDKSRRNPHLYKKLGYGEIKREPTGRGFDLVHMEKSNGDGSKLA